MMISSEERALINEHRRRQAPKLPAEPYTVIKVTWREEQETSPVLMCFPPEWYGEWGWSDGDDFGTADHLSREITDFEVLAKPHIAGIPTDTDMSHETFAETYPGEVQYHYDGGYKDGYAAAQAEHEEQLRQRQLEAIDVLSALKLEPEEALGV